MIENVSSVTDLMENKGFFQKTGMEKRTNATENTIVISPAKK
jgi:hypothetical protein